MSGEPNPSGSAEIDRAHLAQQRYRVPRGGRQILLVRHGSSVGPTLETINLGELTISDPPLSEAGHAQAAALARHLQGERLARLFVTPLQRTHQTAAPLIAATGLVPTVIDDLREAHLGDWEHSFYIHAEAGHPLLKRMFVEESWEVLPNAEPMEHFAARVRNGIVAIANLMEPNETAVAFAHAGTIAEICRQATGSRAFAFMAPENTSVSRLVINADGVWKLRSFNDVSHLGYD